MTISWRLSHQAATGNPPPAVALREAMDAAQRRWLSHRRWCGYCHTHSQTLCPLGKHLLNNYYRADEKMRDLMRGVPR